MITSYAFGQAKWPSSRLATFAAQIEAGLIDDNNALVPHEFEEGLAAYRDWLERHPAVPSRTEQTPQ